MEMDISRASMDTILSSIQDGIYIVDKDRRIVYWNNAAERITGFSRDEVLGRCCYEAILTHVDAKGNLLCNDLCPLAMTLKDRQARSAEAYLHHKAGYRIPIEMRISPLTDSQGTLDLAIEMFSDISHREAFRLRIEELEDDLYLDFLTKLPNRRFLDTQLAKRLAEYHGYSVSFGILFFDIDHFKVVNDTHGHEFGDAILQTVGSTLSRNARPEDTIGRWGGEEFVAIIRNLTGSELLLLAERLRNLVKTSYLLDPVHGEQISVTVSIGATVCLPEDTAHTLITRADHLMYMSKEAGRDCVSTDINRDV